MNSLQHDSPTGYTNREIDANQMSDSSFILTTTTPLLEIRQRVATSMQLEVILSPPPTRRMSTASGQSP
jgi:hypothetical protein